MDSRILSTQLEKLPASGLTLKLHSCSWLNAIYSVFFLLLLITIFLLPVLLWQQLILITGLCCYGQFMFRKHLLFRHPESVNKLVFTELGWCFIELNNSHIIKADIQRDSILTEYLVIINLRDQDLRSFIPGFLKGYSVSLTANSVGADDFRKLKRYLRLISFAKLEQQSAEDEKTSGSG